MKTPIQAPRIVAMHSWVVIVALNASIANEQLFADSTTNLDSAIQTELPLPRWSESELKAFRESSLQSGEGLLPGTGQPMIDFGDLLSPADGPRLDQYPASLSDLPSRLHPEEMRLFLPEGLLGQSPPAEPNESLHVPTPLPALKEVSPEFFAACSNAAPGEFLLDPEVLVPEMQAQSISKFLEFHARDSRVQLHVLIIPKDRKLTPTSPLDQVASGSLVSRESCLLVYPLSEPWRAQLFLSRSVHSRTSEAFLHETLQHCLKSALQSSDAFDQLHRYMVELSTRLFWLQKALGNQPGIASLDEHQLAAVSMTSESSHSPSSVLWLPLAAGTLIGLTGVTLLSWLAVKRWRSKHLTSVWILPEPDTLPRLGGAFTGGGGGAIHY